MGQSSTIQLQFAPTSAGAINGSLTIISDASNSPLAISITGTGTQAGLTIAPSALTFGNVIVGQTGTQSVKLTNSGNSSVTINLATVAGTGFGISGLSLPTTLTARTKPILQRAICTDSERRSVGQHHVHGQRTRLSASCEHGRYGRGYEFER